MILLGLNSKKKKRQNKQQLSPKGPPQFQNVPDKNVPNPIIN